MACSPSVDVNQKRRKERGQVEKEGRERKVSSVEKMMPGDQGD